MCAWSKSCISKGCATGHSRQRGRSRSGPGAGQGSDVEVIITDHHTIPDPPPQALALLHPATTPVDSPYRGLAGVGLAYVLARSLAEALEKPEAIASARDLFCIGTIADMAPLTGANRAWLREGLDHLHRTRCAGLRALQQLSGLEDRALRADDVGFQIAPRINAVGRLGEPSLVVDCSMKTTPIPQLSWPEVMAQPSAA